MNTLPADHGGWSLSGDPRQYGISNTRSDHNLTNNIYGDSNANVGMYHTVITPSMWEWTKSACGSKHGYHHSNLMEGTELLVTVDLTVLVTGFYKGMSSIHGARVKGVHWILPCFVMEAKGLGRPL